MEGWSRGRDGDSGDTARKDHSRRGLLLTVLMATIMVAGMFLIQRGAGGHRAKGADGTMNGMGGGGEGGTSCVRCHAMDGAFSHPVDVVPTMAVPGHLPLENGRMTCLTCHEDAASGQHAAARRDHNSLVRSPGVGVEFCLQCHSGKGEGITSRESQHALMAGQAHLVKSGQGDRGWRSAGGLDGESRNCLSCHDGSAARPVSHQNGGNFLGAGGSHPVGMMYQKRLGVPGKGDMGVKPAVTLDRRIRLFNGNVGCGSCHSPYSTEPGLLVMSNDRSRLCLSCHQE